MRCSIDLTDYFQNESNDHHGVMEIQCGTVQGWFLTNVFIDLVQLFRQVVSELEHDSVTLNVSKDLHVVRISGPMKIQSAIFMQKLVRILEDLLDNNRFVMYIRSARSKQRKQIQNKISSLSGDLDKVYSKLGWSFPLDLDEDDLEED